MKKIIIIICITLLTACKLNHSLTKEQVIIIINDAGYGIEVGCTTQWLDETLCDNAQRILFAARTAVDNIQNGWQAAAKAVLIRERGELGINSKLIPYFDALIGVL